MLPVRAWSTVASDRAISLGSWPAPYGDAEARVNAQAELKAELDQQVADDPSVEPDDVDYSDREVVLAAVSGRWGAIARAEGGDLKTTFLARMLRGEFPADAETTWPQVRAFARDADRFVPPGDARRPAS